MKNRLLIAVVCLLTLPLFTPSNFSGSKINPSAFNSVAFAGHAVGSNAFCSCGCPQCICDPNEAQLICSQSMRLSPQADTGAKQGAPKSSSRDAGADLGAAGLAIVMLILLSLRLRA